MNNPPKVDYGLFRAMMSGSPENPETQEDRKRMNAKKIELNESGLSVRFTVSEEGTVDLERFAPALCAVQGKPSAEESAVNPAVSDPAFENPSVTDPPVSDPAFEKPPVTDPPESGQSAEEAPDRLLAAPIIELQITGTSTRGLHGYKHNSSGASLDLKYVRHEILREDAGCELVIFLKSGYGLEAAYHMRFFRGVPVVRVYTELKNTGSDPLPLEYISSFIFQNLCGGGQLPYYEKTDVYVPRNSWYCEARWQKEDIEQLNLSRMVVDGFNCAGFGANRFCYSGVSSWSSVEYLPMGLVHDRETDETCCFQVESSGQWLIEYDTVPGARLALALSGPTEQEHGWWLSLKPGQSFTTVPAAFGVVKGGTDEALGALTRYRRRIRRPNKDDEALHVVFNDYMNCLMGDPTEENELAIIDRAAEMGCEYYCMDAGWYDKGFWWDRVGEWKESPERFPNGLKSVCDYVRSKGMIMGLWVEIESMGVKCGLAKTLPDNWFICRHGRRHIDNGRYLLDFRNPQVRTYCRDVLERLIADYGVGYFKIDYNVTMGCGSDLNTDSCSGAILDHCRALHAWYEDIFRAHPGLVIEHCGSGAQRMDYGMLSLLSLQSTSDQTDSIYNSYIASVIASGVTPEQGGMWVYPYEDDREHVIYNMVNGLLLRPYMSGMVWKLGEECMDLLKEGVSLYKKIRSDVRQALPFFPLGFNSIRDEVLAYGLRSEDHAFLSVFTPKTDTAVIPLAFKGKKTGSVRVLYPSAADCEYHVKDNILTVKMPQAKAARLFELTLENR